MGKKVVLGFFDDEEKLMHAVEPVKRSGANLHKVYSPFPIHGIDDMIGIKESRLHTAGFFIGLTGLTLMFSFITWISTINWPNTFGGKPNFAMPGWIPIMFEFTVLTSAWGMGLLMLYVSNLYPNVKRHILDPRITDNMFVMCFDLDDSKNDKVEATLKNNGACEVKIEEIPDGKIF
jgi:hypothetical protein